MLKTILFSVSEELRISYPGASYGLIYMIPGLIIEASLFIHPSWRPTAAPWWRHHTGLQHLSVNRLSSPGMRPGSNDHCFISPTRDFSHMCHICHPATAILNIITFLQMFIHLQLQRKSLREWSPYMAYSAPMAHSFRLRTRKSIYWVVIVFSTMIVQIQYSKLLRGLKFAMLAIVQCTFEGSRKYIATWQVCTESDVWRYLLTVFKENVL